jgi:hypothetical protein
MSRQQFSGGHAIREVAVSALDKSSRGFSDNEIEQDGEGSPMLASRYTQ